MRDRRRCHCCRLRRGWGRQWWGWNRGWVWMRGDGRPLCRLWRGFWGLILLVPGRCHCCRLRRRWGGLRKENGLVVTYSRRLLMMSLNNLPQNANGHQKMSEATGKQQIWHVRMELRVGLNERRQSTIVSSSEGFLKFDFACTGRCHCCHLRKGWGGLRKENGLVVTYSQRLLIMSLNNLPQNATLASHKKRVRALANDRCDMWLVTSVPISGCTLRHIQAFTIHYKSGNQQKSKLYNRYLRYLWVCNLIVVILLYIAFSFFSSFSCLANLVINSSRPSINVWLASQSESTSFLSRSLSAHSM